MYPKPDPTMPDADPALVDAYLARLSLTRNALSINYATLRTLMRAHLEAVPFENLDSARGCVPPVSIAESVRKITRRERGGGGWCLTNNGALAWLLWALGFDVRLYGAAVQLRGPNDKVGHLVVVVCLEQHDWLLEAGFGDGSITTPVRLEPHVHFDPNGEYELALHEGVYMLYRLQYGERRPQLKFECRDVTMSDFEERAKEIVADPNLPFSGTRWITRLLDSGPADRVVLRGNKLKVIRGGEEHISYVDDDAFNGALLEWFGCTDVEPTK